eukprot:1122069-Prymnesium_polylepis.1
MQPTLENLVFLVGEQYDKLPDDVRLVTAPSLALAVHDEHVGFTFEGDAMTRVIQNLLKRVRAA